MKKIKKRHNNASNAKAPKCDIVAHKLDAENAKTYILFHALEYQDNRSFCPPKFPIEGNFYLIDCSDTEKIEEIDWRIASLLAQCVCLSKGNRAFVDKRKLIVATQMASDDFQQYLDIVIRAFLRLENHTLLGATGHFGKR